MLLENAKFSETITNLFYVIIKALKTYLFLLPKLL